MSKCDRFSSDIFIPVICGSRRNDLLPLDLSVNSVNFSLSCLQSPEEMEKKIMFLLEESDKKIAFGGYLERRKLYERSKHFTNLTEKRSIHLGVDFWSPEGTEICSPEDGRIHSFQENNRFGDYGPTIIIEHEDSEGVYYTLYGHLSTNSITNIEKGNFISKGSPFAKLGGPEVNGNYAPHLHFQIIKDLEGKMGDYPGVCSANKLSFYRENCPDPSYYLGLK